MPSWIPLIFVVGGALVVACGFRAPVRRIALPFALDLWTSAALIGLLGEQSWPRIAGAALVVGVRCAAVARRLRAGPTAS